MNRMNKKYKKSQSDKILSQCEIDELLEAIVNGDTNKKSFSSQKKVKICDFRRPDILGTESIRILFNHFENFALAIEKFFKTEYELDINVSLISLDQLTREEFIRCTMTPSFTSFASWFSGLAYLSLGPSTFFEGFLNKTNVNCLNLSKFDEKIFCDYIANPCFKKLYETFSKKSKNHLPEFSDFSFESNPMFFPYSETYCEMGTLASFEVSFKGMKKDRVYTMDIFFNKVLLDNLEENGLLFEGIKNRFIPLEKPLGNFVVELGRCYLDDNYVLSKNMVIELDKLVGNPLSIYIDGENQFFGDTVFIDDFKGICVKIDESTTDCDNTFDFSYEKEKLTKDFYNTKVVFGSVFLSKNEIEELGDCSIVELQEYWSDYVLIYKDNELIAKGEVMLVDEHFGVKVKEILNSRHNHHYFEKDENVESSESTSYELKS